MSNVVVRLFASDAREDDARRRALVCWVTVVLFLVKLYNLLQRQNE